MLRLILGTILLLTLPGEVPAWTLHVAAYDVSGSTALAKLLARGVASANREVLNGHNFTLAVLPLNIEPGNNQSRNSVHIAVNELCTAIESRRILALLLVGATPAAVSMALAAGAAGLPLLWARNSTHNVVHQSTSDMDISLEPHATEIALALRALLRSAPWPAFSIVSGEGEMWSGVRSAMSANDLESSSNMPWQRSHSKKNRRRKDIPMPASVHLLRTGVRHDDISKTLSELRRVPRGLVVLLLDPPVAQTVLQEAAAMRMLSSHWVFMLVDAYNASLGTDWPPGLMTLKPKSAALTTKHSTRGLMRMLARLVVYAENKGWLRYESNPSCWRSVSWRQAHFAANVVRWVRYEMNVILGGKSRDLDVAPLAAEFDVMNLARPPTAKKLGWRRVGFIRGSNVSLDSITWPGGGFLGAGVGSRGGKPEFRVVTVPAPPFVMVGSADGGTCVRGVRCMRQDGPACCFGYSMDLLQQLGEDLNFQFHVYVVKDGLHGSRHWHRNGSWSGAVGEIASGRAHLAVAALSITSMRTKVVDFSSPYFYSSVSMLAAPARKNNIPLLAFLLPFSAELWVAIFTSLNVTAIAVAVYEWLSPFGLNPWGRQRTRNFSIASALWVMWGLLCGHLVAFKAPKSWPNKFLINVWGGFSVIFVASYTANIAALIAGDFFQNQAAITDLSLLTHRVGVARATAAEYYIQNSNPTLYQHTRLHPLSDMIDGVKALRNGTLDVLVGDTPVLDYFRGMDPGCKLRRLGDIMNQDMYAIAMSKGFPMKETISDTLAGYARSGLLDMLQSRWWGGLPCFTPESELVQPHPLGVTAVAGVFLLLGLGMVAGLLILLIEHAFYRSVLPALRDKPKESVWRSRNVMFFSQKLYRFINNVQLVSPHHAARELLHTLKKGHITSLFQKSVKRKEHEQRRRRKSKAQFFNMIQEIRRVQAEERDMTLTTTTTSLTSPLSDDAQPPQSPLLLEKRIIAQMHLAQLAAESPVSTPLQIQEISTFPRTFDKRPYEKNAIMHAQNDKNYNANIEFERTVTDGLRMRGRVRTLESSFEQRVPSFYEGRLRRSSAARLASQGSLDAIDIPLSPVNRAPPIRNRETQTLPRTPKEVESIPLRSTGTQCQAMEVPLSPRTLPHTKSRDAQWQARENEMRQQMMKILREKQVLQDRLRILEMCIKPP